MRKIYTIARNLSILLFIIFAVKVAFDVNTNRKQDAVYEEIQEQFSYAQNNSNQESKSEVDSLEQNLSQNSLVEPMEAPEVENADVSENMEIEDDYDFESRKSVYESVAEKNSDVVGWIHVDGTTIDYPVCYTPDDPEFYIDRDINKEKSSYGVPFLMPGNELGGNFIIVGHHMKNGSMFAPLMKYQTKSFYETHKILHFDSLTQSGKYEVVAAVNSDAKGEVIPWHGVMYAQDSEVFDEAWSAVKSHQFYETGVDVEYGDRLIMLVTCEYSRDDGRLLVFAKQISDI